jgi:hypothetical protein
MARGEENLVPRPDLDQASRVHHRDSMGKCSDDGEIVAHVDRSDVVLEAKIANRLEHVCLRGYVETGRGLVEHDQPGAADEGHGNADALLLSARELVRVSPEKLRLVGQVYLSQHLREARPPLLGAPRSPVLLGDLLELRADAEGRI